MINYFLQIKLKYLACFIIISLFYFVLNQTLPSLCSYFYGINKEHPVIVWWTPFVAENQLINCYNNEYNCIVSNDRSSNNIAAYLFYGSHLEPHDLPLPRNQSIWSLFHEESPKNNALLLYKDSQQLFNITSTFSRYSNLPVTLQYLQSSAQLTDLTYFVTVKEKNRLKTEQSLSSILYLQSDCDTPINRDAIVAKLSSFIPIDSYGSCLNNKNAPHELAGVDTFDLYNEKLLRFVSKYKFHLAVENAVCDDYISEKLWRPLMVGAIPIYLGSPTIEDWLPSNNSALLIKNYDNLQVLADEITAIDNDDDLYNGFLQHKLQGTAAFANVHLNQELAKGSYGVESGEDHPVKAFQCFVCKNVHDNVLKIEENVYNCARPLGNNWQYHWIFGKCQTKALKQLVEMNRNFSREEFEAKWNTLYLNSSC